MGFGSFIRGIVAQANPFDNGRTYGSYNPPRRKRPEDQNTPQIFRPSIPQQITPNPQQPTVQRPTNIFDTLNKNLTLGQNNPNVVPVFKTPDNQPIQQPAPGTVVKPSIPFWKRALNDAGNVGGAATGTSLAVLRAGEDLAQGLAETPNILVHAATYPGRLLAGNRDISAKRFADRINQTSENITKRTVNPLKWLSRKTDEAALGYGPTSRAFYKPIQVAANVATLGAGSIEGAAGLASKLSKVEDLSKSEGILGALGRAKNFVDVQRTSPILARLDQILGGNLSKSKFLQRFMPKVENVGPVTGDVSNVLSEADIKDITTRNIPVGTDIPIQGAEDVGQAVRVRNLNEPKPLIRELAGDARSTTPDALAKYEAEQARLQAAADANRTVPDNRVGGVKPGTPQKPFTLDPAEIEKAQKKIVQDYADTLRNMGEGNGVAITQDGRRLSNNVRTAETAGKKMTKTAWREEAQRQLEAGKAEAGHQTAFNDAANPDVQSQLAQGERPNAPAGRPIEVKTATGINVIDQTNVPQNLPETPGKVRVTEATAPSAAKSEAVAKEAPPPPPPVGFTQDGTPIYDRSFETNPNGTTTVKNGATPATSTETLPGPNESDQSFLKRQATDMQANIKRAVDSLKMTKKMTKAQRAEQTAAGEKAFQEAKAAGLSGPEQDAARRAAMRGKFDRADYVGNPIHSADEQRLRDMVDAHYSDMPQQKRTVQEAFSKLFHAGEPGWQSEAGNHIIPSDIKNIRRFLNESVPGVDGQSGLGDLVGSALQELAAQEPGPGKIANAIGLQRALRFTADISATGRQALPGALSHPIEFAKAAKKSFEVMFSHEKYQKYVNELSSSKDAQYINDRMGAYLSVLNDDISKADDIYRNSSWAHKIPGVNKVVAASERQYNTILTEMRRLRSQSYIDAAGSIGNLEKVASDSGDAEGFLKAIGTVANVNTGRGFGKALDTGASKILSDVLVSPRGLAARIQRFNPKYYIDLARTNPAAAKEALRSLGIQTAVTLSALKAASAAGMYEDGQIKVGNTRYDITGGAANMVRTAVRVAQFMSGSRETTPFDNAEGELTRWARNQVAPFLASSLDTIGIHPDKKTGAWVNRWGEDVTLGGEILNNITPLNASQVNQDLQLGTSPAQTAVNAGLNTLGIGVNTYQSAADKKAASSPSNNAVTDKSKFGQTTDAASFKAQAPEQGYNLQKLDDGSYSYSINGEPHNVGSLEKAQEAIAKDSVENSDASYKIIGDKVYRKGADGTVGKPISKTAFDYQLDAATLTSQKKAGNLAGWTKTANKQIDRIQEQLKDPNIDPLDAQKLRNEEQTLVDNIAKYKKYGGFTKGSGGGRRSIDTSFGTLKAGDFAPRVQQYQTIGTKLGNIPHISVVRPNIVHKITSG